MRWKQHVLQGWCVFSVAMDRSSCYGRLDHECNMHTKFGVTKDTVLHIYMAPRLPTMATEILVVIITSKNFSNYL
jgi:hypothetical protein